MKVTHDMYGRAAKCVACHRKWFVPKEDEIPEGTEVIQLAEHAELLRETGVFLRPQSGGSLTGEENVHTPPVGSTGGAEDRGGRPAEGGDTCGKNPLPEYEAPGEPAVKPADPAVGGEEEGLPEEPFGKPDSLAPEPIRSKRKSPFETWEPLRLLCSYQKAFEQLEQRVLADEERGITNEVLEAYARSLRNLRDKFHTKLQLAHESVLKQLTGIEGEIDRLTVALRVGEVDLQHFIANTNALRLSRESLVRLDYNLQAWRQVDDPYEAGGQAVVAMDAFDPEYFDLELPKPVALDDTRPLSVLYSDELRSTLQERTSVEQRIAEWRRIAESRPEKSADVPVGLAEAEAGFKRAKAKIVFLRQRMQQLLADSSHDLDSLQKYRREVLERDRKKQLKRGTKTALLQELEKAESILVRSEAHLRQALHANASAEVPLPTPTLMEQAKPTRLSYRLSCTLGMYVAGVVLVLPVLLFLSWRETGEIHRIVLLPALVVLAQPGALLFRDAWGRMVAAVFLWMVLCAMLVAALLSFARYAPIHAGRNITPYLDSPGMLLAASFFFFGIAVGDAIVKCYHLNLKKAVTLVLGCAFLSAGVPAVTYAWAQQAHAPVAPARAVPAEREPAPALVQATETTVPVAGTAPEGESASIPSGALPVEGPVVEPVTNPDSEPGATVRQPGSEGEAVPYTGGLPVVFSLHGVVHGEGISPVFRASVQYPDQTETSLTLRLGQGIVGDWRASEYNAEAKKLTITNGKKMLLLNPGDHVSIDSATTMEPGQPEK